MTPDAAQEKALSSPNTTEDVYPHSPGYKVGGTSRRAAEAIKPDKSVLSIRPRVSELHRLGLVHETGERRRNESGHRAAVYELAPRLPEVGGAPL